MSCVSNGTNVLATALKALCRNHQSSDTSIATVHITYVGYKVTHFIHYFYSIGEKYTDVNTQDFRTGIWNYIHCIMGIRHDDYDYGRINSLLERGLKSFIKLMTCYPEKVSKKDFDGVMKGFTYSEKVSVLSSMFFCCVKKVFPVKMMMSLMRHWAGFAQVVCFSSGSKGQKYFIFYFYLFQIHVNIILLEARMQAELLYALRAVTQFMTWSELSFLHYTNSYRSCLFSHTETR